MGPPQVPLTQLAPVVIGVMWMETFLAGIFVCLRIWTRSAIGQAGIGWDDAFMGATWSIAQFSKANLLEVIGQTCLITAIATSKTSVALFLLRIVVKTWHKLVLWTAILTLAIICFLCAALNFFQCKPIAHLWNPTIPAECWMNVTNLAIATGAYSVLIDFLLAGLPWVIVWTLNMRKKEKLNIAMALSLGVFAGVCGIIRTVELQGLSAQSDYSYETVSLVIWSASELLITIICANIPMLRPIWSRLRNKSSTHESATPAPPANPTIGSIRQRPGRKDWSELDDMDTMASALGGPKQGKTRTVVKGSFLDDDARSEDSILREGRRGSGVGRGIEVSKMYEVSGGSVSTGGRGW